MASVKDGDGRIILAATRIKGLPLAMYETDNIRNDEVVEIFVRSLAELGISVGQVMTEPALA